MSERAWLENSSYRQRIKTIALTGAMIVSLLVGVGVLFRPWGGAAAPESKFPGRTVIPTQNVRFTIYPEGIHPASATVNKGLISIAIEDLAGTENGVVVERMNGNERTIAGNVKRFERHWRGRSSIDVTPGVYRLRVPGRAIEEAQLTVEP